MSIERLVKQIYPDVENKQEELKPFSDFLGYSNLILLGEPGAGKTYLFEKASEYERGKYTTARNFVIQSNNCKDKIVYIDALDEKRTRKDDPNSIERIVETIMAIQPTKFRLSCRAADWLGETDLELFKPYFEESGGYYVVSLQDLTNEEIGKILITKGINNINDFLNKIREKNLGSLLTNPQTLIMLADIVIKHKQLPNSKKELYEQATNILLEEHNTNHQRKPLAHYNPEQLKEAAGLACAVLLIADIDAISLKPSENYYLSIYKGNINPDIGLAALTRRAFIISNQEQELVTYSHRTIAEYLAACYLVKQIRNGLPIGRVRSLLEIESYPATELHGLYAWLTNLLPEYASQLLISDPYGVLVYGDVSCLSLTNKKALLKALEVLADKDPWFRAQDWTSIPLGALSTPEIAEDFKAILVAQPQQFHLRSIIFDAIKHGAQQQPELKEILLQIFCDETACYADRKGAFECLINAIPNGTSLVIKTTKESLQTTPDNIRLKISVMVSLYKHNFDANDVIQILKDYVNQYNNYYTLGDLWQLKYVIPLSNIPSILDRVVEIKLQDGSEYEEHHEKYHEMHGFYCEILNRYLENIKDVDARKLWLWLSKLYSFDIYYSDNSKMKEWLSKNQNYVLKMFEIGLDECESDDVWFFWYNFGKKVNYLFNICEIISVAFSLIKDKGHHNQKEQKIFQLILALTINTNPSNLELFELLFEYGNSHPELTEALQNACVHIVDDQTWNFKIKRAENKKKDQEKKLKIRSNFERDLELIKSGQHLDWLSWLAIHYCNPRSSDGKLIEPKECLIQNLNEKYAEIALKELCTVTKRTDLPTPLEIATLYIENKYYKWWLAILAGFTESYKTHPDLNDYSLPLLQAALAMNLLYPCFTSKGNMEKEVDYLWKQDLFRLKPELVQAVYLGIIEVLLKAKKVYIGGINDICDKLQLDNRIEAIFNLLEKYPNMDLQNLNLLLLTVIKFPEARIKLISLVQLALNPKTRIRLNRRFLWLSVGFVIDFEQFKNKVALCSNKHEQFIWQLIAVVQSTHLEVVQIKFLIQLVGTHFSNIDHPSGWSGHQNSWDAADFVKAQINRLSTFTEQDATNALAELISTPKLESYRDYLKHAAANQAVLRRKELFHQPNFKEIIEVLNNGKPANIQDLYALTIEHLKDICKQIQNANTDIYKIFWNETYEKKEKKYILTVPRSEDHCRDRLIDLLKPKLSPLEINVEPEGHMVADKRADIILQTTRLKLPIEVKRDYHDELWTACENQLDKLYTRDPQAYGYGIYLIFWFGEQRPRGMPKLPISIKNKPSTAQELETALQSLIKPENKHRLQVIVIDVSPLKKDK